jgi:hypothetical protein
MLKEELQTNIELITAVNFTGKDPSYVENLKALGIADRDSFSYKFKPVFLKRTKEQLTTGKVIKDVPLQPGLIIPLMVVAAIIYFTAVLFWSNDISARQRQMKQEEDALVIPEFFKNLNWQERDGALKKKVEANNALKSVARILKKSFPFLETIPAVLPEGLWLESFSLGGESGKYKGTIAGYVFLGDGDKERLAINDFISNLKSRKEIKSIFSDISLGASQKTESNGFNVTSFSMTLE